MQIHLETTKIMPLEWELSQSFGKDTMFHSILSLGRLDEACAIPGSGQLAQVVLMASLCLIVLCIIVSPALKTVNLKDAETAMMASSNIAKPVNQATL